MTEMSSPHQRDSIVRQSKGDEGAALETTVVPFDENLLERVRTQWQFGDWKSLCKLTRETLQHHPDRAKIALTVAAGHLQMGNNTDARQMIRLARDWGVNKKLVKQILIAGVYNSLGRSATLLGLHQCALKHFKSSVAIGSPGSDLHLITDARANHQLADFEFRNCSVMHVSARTHLRKQAVSSVLPASRASKFFSSADFPMIVIAGMRHSGSTALFNIVRLSLEKVKADFTSGYSESKDFQKQVLDSKKLRLVKIHEFRDDVAMANGFVITTRRDLRDTVASAKRRAFPMLERIGGEIEYAKYNRLLHDIWVPLSDYVFEYEKFMSDPVSVIKQIILLLGIDHVSAEEIYELVIHLPFDQYNTTLLSPDHITDSERTRTYSDTLGINVVEKINSDHSTWLDRYGYSV